MSLKEILKGNWDKSSFMKISLNENIRTQIENDTQFLNSYYDKIPLRTRAYVIINSIDNSYNKLYETKILNKTNYEIYNCGYLLLRYG